MELFNLFFTLVSLTLAMFPTKSHADDFADAFAKIEAVKTNINYNKFCKELAQGGEEKIACRIKAVPSIGFLVCRYPTYCLQQITTEIDNLRKLQRDGIKTVKLAPRSDMRIIQNVKCGSQSTSDCSGFLVEWISRSIGRFEHIRDRIANNEIPDLIANVESFTRSDNLKRSCRDLNDILNYMQERSVRYRQICDLQGFFLVNGGFIVADTPQIKTKMGPKEPCWEGEPTTEQVFTALMTLRDRFKNKKKKKSDAFMLWPPFQYTH